MSAFATQNGSVRPPAGRKHAKHEDEEAGKLFVGGLSWETSQDSLLRYFSRFGEVIDCVVMKNAETGRSRGFGFVTFGDPANMDKVIQSCPHVLDGRTIDPKPCNPRSMQQKPKRNSNWPKVFLGGLPSSITETDLRAYFTRYGEVTEVVIMYDQEKKKARGFGFLSFLTDDAVDRAVVDHYVTIQNKQVEIKRAEPRNTMMSELMAAAASSNGPIMDQWGGIQPANNGIHTSATAAVTAYSSWGAPPVATVVTQPTAAVAAVPLTFSSQPASAFSMTAAAAAPLPNHHHHWGGTPPPPAQHTNNNNQPSPSHHHHNHGWGGVALTQQQPHTASNGGGAAFSTLVTGQQQPPPLHYAAAPPQQQQHTFAPPPPLAHANGTTPVTANPHHHHHHHSYAASYWGSPPGLTPPPPSTPGEIFMPAVSCGTGGAPLHSSPPQHKFELSLAGTTATVAPPPFSLHQPAAADYRVYAKPPNMSGGASQQYSAGPPTSPEYFSAAAAPPHHHHHHVSYVVSEPSRVIMQQQQPAVATYGGPPVVTTYLTYRRT